MHLVYYAYIYIPHYTGKIYKWNHGLLQGEQLSPAFCELYM